MVNVVDCRDAGLELVKVLIREETLTMKRPRR